MKISKIIVFVILMLNISYPVYACTTAIVSGKATPDGRPLLWKHRDSDHVKNKLMFFEGEKYNYIGLVNSEDATGNEIWAGTNSAGFCIMNAASYNLKNEADTTKIMDMEGKFMKKALEQCASVDDFEQFLRNHLKPMRVEANFGVIDAQGNGAYFETCNFKYTKFDVNDPNVAPHGYILRSNYSYSGKKDEGYGYIRFETARQYFAEAEATGNISLDFILNTPTRSLRHSLTKTDYRKDLPEKGSSPRMVFFDDMIARHSSVSSIIFQGVRPDEKPELTTMWTVLGFQFCSVAVPVWVAGGKELPSILTADKAKNAPLCELALTLKEQCYPVKRGSGYKYLNLAAVINQENSGIYQQLQPVEKQILQTTHEKMTEWRNKGYHKKSIQKYYKWLDQFLKNKYKQLFNL